MSAFNDTTLADLSPFLLKELIERRQKAWAWALEQPLHRKLELEICKRDRIHWINKWVWILEPRKQAKQKSTIPMLLFPKQEEFLHWMDGRRKGREQGIVEKSRGTGGTYLCITYALHSWLFEDEFKATFGSRTEDLVDRSDDPDSIFEKMRRILYKLPPWMLPEGFNKRKHDKFMRLVNPVNGSIITGEGGQQIGRGGRATIVFLDEAAHLEGATNIDAAVSETSDVVIWVSTPKGTANVFAQKRNSGQIAVFSFPWHSNLTRNQEWYLKKKRTLDKVVFSQEIDLNYSASESDLLIMPDWVDAAVALYERLGNYFLGDERVAALDVAASGDNRNVFGVKQGICLAYIEEWKGTNTTGTAYKAAQLCSENNIYKLIYDEVGVGAGVAGVLESGEWRFDHVGFNGGASCTKEIWESFGDRDSSEIFANLRAECGWLLRVRFEKTYEFLYEGRNHPIDELIAIPDHPELKMQLCQPKFFYTDKGLIRLEKKVEMKKRGIESPDFFDMCMMAFSDQIGFDYLDALYGAQQGGILLGAEVEDSLAETRFKLQLRQALYDGQKVTTTKENYYSAVRSTILEIAEEFSDSEDVIRTTFALGEVKRLDTMFESNSYDNYGVGFYG